MEDPSHTEHLKAKKIPLNIELRGIFLFTLYEASRRVDLSDTLWCCTGLTRLDLDEVCSRAPSERCCVMDDTCTRCFPGDSSCSFSVAGEDEVEDLTEDPSVPSVGDSDRSDREYSKEADTKNKCAYDFFADDT